MRRAGNDMRINAQLIDATTSGHVWAERFDGAWVDVLTLQDKVIQEVAAALQLRLVSTRDEGANAGGTAVPAAYDAYLRGLEHEKRGSPDDWIKAAALYEEARRLDPDFGRASAKLAWVYRIAFDNEQIIAALGGSREAKFRKVDEHLGQAEKHPSATYYQVLAELYLWQQKSEEAIGAAERAIALDPSDAYAYEEKSLALSINGRPTEALAQLDIARQVDPNLSSRRGFLAALAYFGLDRFADAIAVLQEADPNATEAWKYEFEIAAPCIGRRTPWRRSDDGIEQAETAGMVRQDRTDTASWADEFLLQPAG